MARFKDASGREWKVEIENFGAVKRLRTEAGFDLNKIDATESFVEVLLGDAEQLLAAVWWLVRGQDPNVDQDAFLAAIDAATLDRAKRAVVDAVFDFFHHGRAAAMKSRLQAVLDASLTPTGSNAKDGSLPASAG